MTYFDKEFCVHPTSEPIASSNGTHRRRATGSVYVPVPVKIVQPKWWGNVVYKGSVLVRIEEYKVGEKE